MKKILAFFINRARYRLAHRNPYHNDALRANQFIDPAHTFSFWRALVS